MAKKKISQRERNRRDEQRRQQWEKDNPVAAAAMKETERRSVLPRDRRLDHLFGY